MSDPLAPVAEIMSRRGARCSPTEFHAAVNRTFHQYESEHYDELHRDMWGSLPQQVALLADDCLHAGTSERMRALDIGCGTGLASDLLLRTKLGERISEIDLLDTSPAMLARAEDRRKQWAKPGKTIEGLVENIVGTKSYDLIITCSVLHHVPDLASFLEAVAALQKDAGCAFFLHLQDPNGDFSSDPVRIARSAEIRSKRSPEWLARLAPQRVIGRLKRELSGEQGQDYLSKTNRELMGSGVITSPLTTPEIFSITDIHVHDGAGISITRMKAWLPNHELISSRSYAFFGELWSSLPPDVRQQEDDLVRDKAQNGEYVGAVWQRSNGTC